MMNYKSNVYLKSNEVFMKEVAFLVNKLIYRGNKCCKNKCYEKMRCENDRNIGIRGNWQECFKVS